MEAFLPEPMQFFFNKLQQEINITRETMLEVTVLLSYLLLLKAINFNSNKKHGGQIGISSKLTDIRVLHHQIYLVLLIPQYLFPSISLITFHLWQLLCQNPYQTAVPIHTWIKKISSFIAFLQISPGSPNSVPKHIPKGQLNFY